MKYTLLHEGKPIMECEPVTPVPATFEYRANILVWQFKGGGVDGRHELKVDGKVVEPWYIGQTGEIELTNGELIEFIAVKKEARQ